MRNVSISKVSGSTWKSKPTNGSVASNAGSVTSDES